MFIIVACFAGKLSAAQDPALMAQIRFTPREMVVMSSQAWAKEDLDLPQVTAALEAYHQTQAYTQTLDQFRQHPGKYFADRLAALDNLLHSTAEAAAFHPALKQLHQSALNKKLYIQALPDMLEIHSTKPEALGLLPAARTLSVAEHYWSEIIDPLHRARTNLYLWRWEASAIPNYFIYLDTVEDDTLLNTFAPLDFQINYFYTEEERRQHRLHFENGLAYTHDGQLFDSSEYAAAHSGEGFAIFVIGQDLNFYVNHHLGAGLHHSSEFAGGDVVGAGEMIVDKGRIRAISNKSGHYVPQVEDMLETLRILKDKIGSLEGITAHMWLYTRFAPYAADYQAEEYLNASGRCLPLPSSTIPALQAVILQDYAEYAELLMPEAAIDEVAYGYTALHIAALLQRPYWIQLLLDSNASTSLMDGQGRTALEVAAASGSLDAIQLLFPATQDESIRLKAIFAVAKSGNLPSFLYVLKQQFLVSQTDECGNTLFHYAAMAPNADILRHLLNTDAAEHVFMGNALNESPLHWAAAYGCLETFRLLLDLGLTLDLADVHGDTVLHFAAKSDQSDIVAFCLENAPEELYHIKNRHGAIPLHYAALGLPNKLLTKFLDKTGDPEVRDDQGETLLFYALRGNNYQGYCALVENRADIKAVNIQGYSLVHAAAAVEGLGVMLALTYDNQLNAAAPDGNTPLHLAMLSKNHYAIYLLLNFATPESIQSPNAAGQNILDLARQLDDKDILDQVTDLLL